MINDTTELIQFVNEHTFMISLNPIQAKKKKIHVKKWNDNYINYIQDTQINYVLNETVCSLEYFHVQIDLYRELSFCLMWKFLALQFRRGQS